MKYNLYLYAGYYETYTLVKANCTIKNVQKEIDKWCRNNNFKSYYTRTWSRDDGALVYDFGSHNLFFVLKPEGKEENTDD